MDSRRAAIWRIAIGGVVVSAVFLGMIVTGSVPSPDEVRDYGDSLGLLAVLAFVPLFVPANFLISWPILSGAAAMGAGVVVLLRARFPGRDLDGLLDAAVVAVRTPGSSRRSCRRKTPRRAARASRT